MASEAFLLGTEEPSSAATVGGSEALRARQWVCKVCRVPYSLASLHSDVFKPYFTPLHGHRHRPLCPEASAGGPRCVPKTSMGPPAEVVSKITFPPPGRSVRGIGRGPERERVAGLGHTSTRQGLLEACELHYFRGAELIGEPLDVDGVRPGGTYGRVFKPAPFPISRPEDGIWFADLRATAPICLEKDALTFSLQVLERGASRAVGAYVRVRADMRNWRDPQKRSVVGMVAAVHKAAQWTRERTPRAPRTYVLAQRTPEMPGMITFTDYRHLAFVLDGR